MYYSDLFSKYISYSEDSNKERVIYLMNDKFANNYPNFYGSDIEYPSNTIIFSTNEN